MPGRPAVDATMKCPACGGDVVHRFDPAPIKDLKFQAPFGGAGDYFCAQCQISYRGPAKQRA